MCGLGVWFDPRPSEEGVERTVRLHAPIRHRGPDDEGFLFVAGDGTLMRCSSRALPPRKRITLGMAFRRLGILDLRPEAAQPMGSADRATWLVFNGEIYNFRELRAELGAAGREFRSHGDTEVLLAAYERWGEGCFAHLEGMWALAILDLRKRRLVVSRDRFGIKPLHWALCDGALLLASEAKQILHAQGVRPAPNRPLVEMYLRGTRYPFVDETFFEGIQLMPPATWASWPLDDPPQAPMFHPYWALADHVAHPSRAVPYAEAKDRVEETLTRAVASHMVADVEVGALLSGGLDSAALVALSSKRLGRSLPTFSLGFRDKAPRFCELPFVDALVKDAALVNHETTFDAGWVAENIDRVLFALEEPPLAMPALAQYRVFELVARHGLRVVLDGQGADEIAAGYAYHQRALLKDRLGQGRILGFTTEARAIAAREDRSVWSVIKEHFVASRLRLRRPYDWIAAAPLRANLSELLAARSDYGRDVSLVNRHLYYDVRWGNAKIILGYGDRNAMAHSVEARVPYFDRAFVELLFSLPDDYKVSHGDRKRVLRDVARRWVPPAITERTDRMGFGSPDEEMMRGPLAAHVQSGLFDSDLLRSGVVRPEAVQRFHADFVRGLHQDHRAIWRLYSLARWSQRFEVSW